MKKLYFLFMSHFFVKFYFAQIDSDYKYDNSKKYFEVKSMCLNLEIGLFLFLEPQENFKIT